MVAQVGQNAAGFAEPQLLGLPESENELRPERAIPPSVTITLPITSALRARLGIAFPHAPHVEHKAIVAEDAKPLSLRPPTHSHHEVLGLFLGGLQIRRVMRQPIDHLRALVAPTEPNDLDFKPHGKGSTVLVLC
jgi:hypothetical protein